MMKMNKSLITAVVCVISRLDPNDPKRIQFLAIDRKDEPLGIALIGGKVDPNEDPMVSVKREAKEEAGLNILKVRKIFEMPRMYDMQNVRDKQNELVAFYYATLFDDISKKALEQEEYRYSTDEGDIRWAHLEEIIGGPYGKSNAFFLRSFIMQNKKFFIHH